MERVPRHTQPFVSGAGLIVLTNVKIQNLARSVRVCLFLGLERSKVQIEHDARPSISINIRRSLEEFLKERPPPSQYVSLVSWLSERRQNAPGIVVEDNAKNGLPETIQKLQSEAATIG